MGVYHRDYMRDEPGRPGGGGLMSGPGAWSVLTWLLVINVAVFLLQFVLLAPANPGPNWAPWGGFSWEGLKSGHVWELVTTMFVHGSFMHLALNCLGLFFIGRMLQTMLPPKLFLIVYLGSGIAGGVFQLLFSTLIEREEFYLLGASGCVYGLLCAMAALIPNQTITMLLFFVIPVRARMKTIAFVAVGISIALVLVGLVSPSSGSPVQVGHMAHLGGAFFGWFFIAKIFPKLKRQSNNQARRKRWGIKFGAKSVVDADYTDGGRVDPAADRRRAAREKKRAVSSEVDAILDKINEKGFQSLTEKERKILDASADKLDR